MAPPRRHCQPRHAAVSSGHLHSGSSSCGVKRRGVKRNEIGEISEPDRSDIGVLGGDSGRPQHGAAGPERPELCSEAQRAPARASPCSATCQDGDLILSLSLALA